MERLANRSVPLSSVCTFILFYKLVRKLGFKDYVVFLLFGLRFQLCAKLINLLLLYEISAYQV